MPSRIKGLSQTIMTPLWPSIQQLLGQYCAGCRQYGSSKLCNNCIEQLVKPDYVCRVCGIAMMAQTKGQCCKDCLVKPPAFDELYYVGNYEGRLADWIIAAKIGKRVEAIESLSYLTQQYSEQLNHLSNIHDYYLLPMPTPTSRLMHRGFNLPLILAKTLSQTLGLPILPADTVELPFWVRKQGKLSGQQRRKNRHFYQINHKLPDNIVIVDDILTTGATMNELAKSLRQKNVKHIAVWTLARSQLKTVLV